MTATTSTTTAPATRPLRMSSVEVTVVESRGLKDSDFFGKADPYLLATVGDHSLKSKTKESAGTNTSFNETFMFPLSSGAPADTLTIDLMDDDTLGRDDLLGRVSIPLAGLLASGAVDQWLQLTKKDGKPVAGAEMHVRVWPKAVME